MTKLSNWRSSGNVIQRPLGSTSHAGWSRFAKREREATIHFPPRRGNEIPHVLPKGITMVVDPHRLEQLARQRVLVVVLAGDAELELGIPGTFDRVGVNAYHGTSQSQCTRRCWNTPSTCRSE